MQQEEIREAWRDARYRIDSKWDSEYLTRLRELQTERRNRLRGQLRLGAALSAVSPFGAMRLVSTDLARTGPVQQEWVEDALNAYLIHLGAYVRDKMRRTSGGTFQGVDLADFSWFTYRDEEPVGECLARNVFPILNLILLAILGFAGAYAAILRYDVR